MFMRIPYGKRIHILNICILNNRANNSQRFALIGGYRGEVLFIVSGQTIVYTYPKQAVAIFYKRRN